MMKSFIKCKCLSQLMRLRHGEHIYLPYNEARLLHAKGEVEITDKDVNIREVKDTHYVFKQGFSKRKLSRIAWVQNYDKHGGAEISNFVCVNVGQQTGFDVVGYVPGVRSNRSVLEQSDLVIVNNLHCTPDDKNNFLKWLFASRKLYIVYSHDHFESVLELFTRSLLNFFISPDHFERYQAKIETDIRGRSVVLPLAFDTAPYNPAGAHKKGTVFIPAYEKCRSNVLRFMSENPQLTYYITDGQPAGKNVTCIGKVDYTAMPAEYVKYETVLHVPERACAGERVLFEAVMCGCKIITNENAGHSSWTFNWRDPAVLSPTLERAPYQFWSKINEVLSDCN